MKKLVLFISWNVKVFFMTIKDTQYDRVIWDGEGLPRSSKFDDKYFCLDNGYEEAVYVNCEGNGLRERFLALDPSRAGTFTILETGFGTGLDFCCAWQMWEACAPKTWTLDFVSLELYPMTIEEISRALALWPRLSSYKEELVAQYTPVPGEIKKMSFKEGRVRLTIVFDDVLVALKTMKDRQLVPHGADAVFLDGFGPAKNPEMWTQPVFDGVALLSHGGTTLSTFTVAGAVRRGLQAAGFRVERIKGHGKKNQILVGIKN
jgi:tRNA 5-methylaminomethyl-2-thiouridine biosynthesis bifunctional protein